MTPKYPSINTTLLLIAVFGIFATPLSSPGAPGLDGSSETYRTPPDPIPRILDTPPTPSVSLNPDRTVLAIFTPEAMPSIGRLAEPELRLAGIRINPNTNGPGRELYFLAIEFQDLESGKATDVPLPDDALISHARWSADGSLLAFANTTAAGIELWVANPESAEARRLTGPELNVTLGTPFQWMPDENSLLIRRVPPNRGPAPEPPLKPAGPIVQETTGPSGPVRTYQDLLGTPHDEALFQHYFTSQIARVRSDDKSVQPIGRAGIFRSATVSPNGEYILTREIKRPYTYQAPFFTFGAEVNVLDLAGNRVYQVEDRTEIVLPRIGRDMVNTGPRFVHWRADAPSTLVWAEAMDEGDARGEAEVRDRVVILDAPFDTEPRTLIDLDQRYRGIDWGRDDLALVHSLWRTSSRTKTHIVNPGRPKTEPRILWDRSSEDRYGDPGSPLTRTNRAGRSVLRFDSGSDAVFLTGDGASSRGDYPFLDRLDLETGVTERQWQAEDPHYERVIALGDDDGRSLIIRRESQESPPNYFVVENHGHSERRLTDFPDPAPQLAGIQRKIITYPREDGTNLSATLITPPGYDAETDGPLPMLVWAYPREFRDADAAGQVRDSPNRFSRPRYTSPLFLLTQGYAILSGPAMPIIGEGDDEPNDTYIEQLVASAEAAVNTVAEMGVAERDRIAIAGHSYGAFMAANLLAHSDLFRAGIARSGAYNRTLTPFGFQAEPRSYWEARDTYLNMSPFNYADRIEAPVLLIHGQEDNNSGTYPMQSERMYQAIAGNGGTARLVMLPHESHGYLSRQSVNHVLAEMIDWLDNYLKPSETDEAH